MYFVHGADVDAEVAKVWNWINGKITNWNVRISWLQIAIQQNAFVRVQQLEWPRKQLKVQRTCCLQLSLILKMCVSVLQLRYLPYFISYKYIWTTDDCIQ